MAIQKIIFILGMFYCKKDYDFYRVQDLVQQNIKVEFWDLTTIFCPDLSRELLGQNVKQDSHLVIFHDKSEVQSAIQQLQSDMLVIPVLAFDSNTYFVFRALTKYAVKYALYEANYVPYGARSQRKKYSTLLERIKARLRIGWIVRFAMRQSPLWLLNIKPADYILAGGDKCHGRCAPQNYKSKILFLHAPDYDVYLDEKRDQPPLLDGDYIVFLDEAVPFHTDFIFMKIDPPVRPDQYYSALRTFFDYLESKLKMRVVISAHPRSNYEDHPDYFNGRQVIKGHSAHLVKYCKLAMTHASSSMNYAVLYQKAILFLTTNQLEASFFRPWIAIMAGYVGKKPINVEDFDDEELAGLFAVNDQAYARYRQDYIKRDDSKDGYFWDLTLEYINDDIAERSVDV